MKSYRICFLLFLCIGLVTCGKDKNPECIKRTGPIQKITRELTDYSVIEVFDHLNVFLVQDTMSYIEINAGKNITPDIETTIEGNRLIVRNNNTCSIFRSYKYPVEVTLHFKKLNELIYHGTGPVTCINTIHSDTFTFNSWDGVDTVKLNLEVQTCFANIHTGVADVIATGRAYQLYAYTRGSGALRFQKFISTKVYANNLSSSDQYFYAEQELEALVQYVGNIYYYGNPAQIIKSVTNKGSLIPL